MVAPVRSMSDRLRVTRGISAAMACDAMSRSRSAMGLPAASSVAFNAPQILAAVLSGCRTRSPQRITMSWRALASRSRRTGSAAFAIPNSISARTMVERNRRRSCRARNDNISGSGRGRVNSPQTLVSISTEHLTARIDVPPLRWFQVRSISNRHQMRDERRTRHRPDALGVFISDRWVGALQKRSNLRFHRAAVLHTFQPGAVLDRVVDVSDRDTSHAAPVMIALQSLPAKVA